MVPGGGFSLRGLEFWQRRSDKPLMLHGLKLPIDVAGVTALDLGTHRARAGTAGRRDTLARLGTRGLSFPGA